MNIAPPQLSIFRRPWKKRKASAHKKFQRDHVDPQDQ